MAILSQKKRTITLEMVDLLWETARETARISLWALYVETYPWFETIFENSAKTKQQRLNMVCFFLDHWRSLLQSNKA